MCSVAPEDVQSFLFHHYILTHMNILNDLIKRAKLCLKDAFEPAELYLSKCYFLWNNEIRRLKNSGSTGLSFMVVLSKSYVQNLEHKAIAEALILNLQQRIDGMLMILMHDSHLRNSLANFKRF